ncbi:MAG: hypothetical protein U9Q07_05595 [Planctomycetota bacterium]|nr:hypothetical protein [Planctomycetota bacterium]
MFASKVAGTWFWDEKLKALVKRAGDAVGGENLFIQDATGRVSKVVVKKTKKEEK